MAVLTSAAAGAFPSPGHAAGTDGAFDARYVVTSDLNQCGTNTYCITDQGKGDAAGFGPSTVTIIVKEITVDPNSPCNYRTIQGSAKMVNGDGDTLTMSIVTRTCEFQDQGSAVLIKPGSFKVTGGTGVYAHATGSGILYKLTVFGNPIADWRFTGTVTGVVNPGRKGSTKLEAMGGSTCENSPNGVICSIPTTNTVTRYFAATCGSTSVYGQYVAKDAYDVGFDRTDKAIRWVDKGNAQRSFSGASSHNVSFNYSVTGALHFKKPGNFATAATTYTGPGITFAAHGIPALLPAKVHYDANGQIQVNTSPTLTALCTTLGAH